MVQNIKELLKYKGQHVSKDHTLFDMKIKIFNLIMMLLVPLQMCFAQNIKNVSVTFDISDFTLHADSNGVLDIISDKQVASYDEDISEPGLPLIPVNVLIPEGKSFASLTVSTSKSLVRENVTVAANPQMMPTFKPETDDAENIPEYASKVYPAASGVYK